MAKNSTLATTPEQIAARKAELDAQFHAGTKAQRTALMAANGLRKAREDKGYGRAAVAKALKVTPAEWWVAEFVLQVGTPAHKAMLARVASLPSVKATKATGSKAGTPAKGKARTPAKGRVNVAKPKASSNQADITDLV